jgi:adenosylhomocysteine nucleosidase
MATADTNPIVAIAAEAREFSGLLRHASRVTPLPWPVDFARRAEIAGAPWVLAANGPGPQLAARAVEAATASERPRALLSTGFCGALDPSLQTGDVFVTRCLQAPEQSKSYAGLPVQSDRQHRHGTLVSLDRVAVTSEEKAALRAGGADAVEMEAAAVAHQADRLQTPFFCVRVVSDSAADTLPFDFNRYRDAQGRFSRSRIAVAALLRPAALAGLLRLDSHCRRASILLGDFLATCRF